MVWTGRQIRDDKRCAIDDELPNSYLSDIQEKRVLRLRSYNRSDSAIEAAQRSWAAIFCNTRVYLHELQLEIYSDLDYFCSVALCTAFPHS